MIKAIIFDMDGVISDTEYLDFQLQSKFVIESGGTTDQEKLFDLVGKSYKNLFMTMKKLIGTEDSLELIQEKYDNFIDNTYELIDYQDYFRKDIVKILDYAKKNNISLAVASSSAMFHIKQILEQCGIIQEFDFIISGESLEESKPNPEIYLRTLENFGINPSEAIAIEDSPGGIAAAKAAGIPVIAYLEERMVIDQSQADYFGKDMIEIYDIIQSLVNEIK